MTRLLLILALAGCGLKAPPKPPVSESAPERAEPNGLAESPSTDLTDAAAGVQSPRLRQILRRHWRATLDGSPEWAGSLGHEAYIDKLGDNSPAARRAWIEDLTGYLEQARALPADSLTPADAVTRRLFVEQVEAELAEQVCAFPTWSISARYNPYTYASTLPLWLPVTSPERARATVARYRALPDRVRQEVVNLREGLSAGAVANRRSVQLVVDQLGPELERDAEAWPLWQAVEGASGLSEAEQAELETQVRELIDGPIRVAFVEYTDFLRDEVLPKARPDERAGLLHLPVGEACYAALIQRYTTLPDATAASVHQAGLDALEGIHQEFRELGGRALDEPEIGPLFERLRTDSALYFETEEQVEQAAIDALDRAREAMPEWFGRLPVRECIVERVPEHEAPFTTIAYYRQPTREHPGRYTINTYAPTTRPRHEAEVLAYHESIPGHHLQIAIAQELDAMPAFRRHQGMTVFVEGWALYTERLADEMGLYTDDLSRLGMLSFDAWRAARLVVDTGLHAKGWSREQAEAFMDENTPLARNNISNEVDRYLTTPGQALAYKTGQTEIWALRRQAEAELGDAFSLPGFHDVVLGGGAVSLPVLREQVEAWIAERSQER